MRKKLSLALACMVGAMALAGGASATIVPNIFVRYCSYITRHCTGYSQTNGRYNPAYPSEHTTLWTWWAIW
jgi:hypothetical protein